MRAKILNLLTSFFHKIASIFIHKLQRALNSATIGARAIIVNDKNEILLVKHTYQKDWYIPGGGVKTGEPTQQALARELKEEVGLIVQSDPIFFSIYYNDYMGANDYPVIYIVKNFTLEKSNSPEIQCMKWFSLTNIPEDASPGTKRRIKEYLGEIPQSQKW
ncbi:MAG: NUDIX domain-containing protein [Bdellovibrionota bacterium]